MSVMDGRELSANESEYRNELKETGLRTSDDRD